MLDFSLYNSFYDYNLPSCAPFDFVDAVIPMWELTYHGITLYNPCSLSINYPIKGSDSETTYRFYGGKPSFYIYSRFLTEGRSRMGEVDFTLDTEEAFERVVSLVRRAAVGYSEIADLQFEYKHSYFETKDGLKVIRYESGAESVANYSDSAICYNGREILSHSCVFLGKSSK